MWTDPLGVGPPPAWSGTKGNSHKRQTKWTNMLYQDRQGARGAGQCQEEQEMDQGPPGEPSLGTIMAAIQDLKGLLEPTLDAVTMDVTLLKADLKKVAEKVTNAETDIAHLQSTSKRLGDQVQFLTAEHERIVARFEDQEGRAWRNNFRVVGVPEGVKGPSVELFLETLITDSFQLKRLSMFFTVERAHRAPPSAAGGPSKDNHQENIQLSVQKYHPSGR
ncbi:hypothetical protein NDU88_000619 [Pleurodeles waltl]|uniref:Uncharacterized protein n=1 Tax=Pleurodeles waltl TaxID=8319 RepID=A0AAV7MIK8_PLEWA|nr:hypothetical protein NDU88_000619 [Pleurodeles waltl]